MSIGVHIKRVGVGLFQKKYFKTKVQKYLEFEFNCENLIFKRLYTNYWPHDPKVVGSNPGHLKNGPTPASFSFIFALFQTNIITIFTTD